MRLILVQCSVSYEGRLNAYLPSAKRLIMSKADGCIAIHADGGAYKPLMWMNAPNRVTEEESEWLITNPKGEKLRIEIEEIFLDTSYELGDDPGLHKDGVESHLQELLAENPQSLEDGLTLTRREYFTDIGPVDLLCRDKDGQAVAIEIKRRGGIDGVEQLTRYLDFLNRDPKLRPVRGIFAAQQITPQAKVLAKDREISTIEVDYEELRGMESTILRLF
ncbi:MAG: endonuclease NucS [Acidimicrobiales bacterium]|nr:endonuclease NucS [Acidimicrobiales bacterium]MDP6297833.1 endonuclease NucS [Acidimicrobiales bacterium]HJM29333.1 endonuclease NucS [Acidimicrobiales bacterium]